jgi:hypothetical protein
VDDDGRNKTPSLCDPPGNGINLYRAHSGKAGGLVTLLRRRKKSPAR